MAVDVKHEAVAILHRFGLGPGPAGSSAIASDPREALLAELDRPDPGRLDNTRLLTSDEAAVGVTKQRAERRAARQAAKQGGDRQPKTDAADRVAARRRRRRLRLEAATGCSADIPLPARLPRDVGPRSAGQILNQEGAARIGNAAAAEIGLAERLVWFWSNHFCVSAAKGLMVRALAGSYEREAIRPHITGRFADMLVAAATHPAMLLYLDNAMSVGPESAVGSGRKRGLNENLAREILELHTLGVRGGYSQEDVTRFAHVITGWTVIPPHEGHSGFMFNHCTHQPGEQAILGKLYADAGFEQGRQVLLELARHPATADHIATKLVRHFIADDPPPSVVHRVAQRFRQTDGDLKEVVRALITAPEALASPRAKLKRPSEWLIGAARAVGGSPNSGFLLRAQRLLGEPLWAPPSPKGFSDDSEAWLGGMAQRVDIAVELARRTDRTADPRDVLEAAIGPLASVETRRAVAAGESREQGLAILFMAPEFQRR